MIPVATAAEVRALDAHMIEALGLPGIALMESASAGVARAIATHHDVEARDGVVIATGGGNNGGDGWAIARWLHGWGYPVQVWSVRDPTTDDARTMAAVARAAGVPTCDGPGAAGLLVDAVLGTGLESPVRPGLDAVLATLRDHAAPVVAVDLPSGLHSDTGEALGAVPEAVRTVTFACAKRGLYTGQGPALAGAVDVVDIGLDVAARGCPAPGAFLLEADDVTWPRRARGAHKGDSGHLAVVAGSRAMAGAAILACRGALAAGAGRITLVTAEGALPRLAGLPPEIMVHLSGGEVLDALPDLTFADAVVAGPGLGGGHPLPAALHDELAALWSTADTPLIFDADALVACSDPGDRPRVLTPHPGEAGRMLGQSVAEVQRDRFRSVEALSVHGVAVLKGPFTLVHAEGTTTINPTGSAALATGGTGDVLAGMVGALLARGVAPGAAARAAVWRHGVAGEHCGEGSGASAVADAVATLQRG